MKKKDLNPYLKFLRILTNSILSNEATESEKIWNYFVLFYSNKSQNGGIKNRTVKLVLHSLRIVLGVLKDKHKDAPIQPGIWAGRPTAPDSAHNPITG